MDAIEKHTITDSAETVDPEIRYNHFEVCMRLVDAGRITFEAAIEAFQKGEVPVEGIDTLAATAIQSAE